MSKKRNCKASIGVYTLESDVFKGAVTYGDKVLTATNQLLAIWGMTALQHNTLRVIYTQDVEDRGMPSGEIGKHLYTRVPDMTRLLDRLADKGWLVRERDPVNRRVVLARLTDIGIELVESTHSSLVILEKEQLAHLTETDKNELKRLLALAVSGGPKETED